MVIRRARGSVAMPLCPSQVLITTAVLFLVAIANTDGRDTGAVSSFHYYRYIFVHTSIILLNSI